MSDFTIVQPDGPLYRLARTPDPWAWPDWASTCREWRYSVFGVSAATFADTATLQESKPTRRIGKYASSCAICRGS
jgi:hypothetical protein